MNRRVFIAASVCVFAAPVAARAQRAGKVYRVGVLRPAPDNPRFRTDFDGFRQALRESGYVDGANLTIEYRMKSASQEQMIALARELVRLTVDVILAIGPVSVTAAAALAPSIPVVAVDLETDPVATGLVASLARPGRNVTGLFLDFPELSGKWLQLLQEAVPRLSRVAVLWDPATGPAQLRAAEAAARTLRLQLQPVEAPQPKDLEPALQLANKARAGALLVLSSPVFNAFRKQIADLATRHRLPTIMPFPGFAEDGGLMGYGPHLLEMFRQAGTHVVKVLNGVPAGEIPVERPSRFSLTINLKTAKLLGLTIPQPLLQRADEVIQ